MERTRTLFLMAGVAILFLQTSCSTPRAIAHYSGDGEIFALPDGGFWQGGGGYEVRFKCVRLDHPSHLTYHFTGLPKIAWHVEVFFAIDDSRWWEDKRQYEFDQRPSQRAWAEKHHLENDACYDDLVGTLSMTLRDSGGHVIFNVSHKLSDFVWSRAGLGPWELYDRDFKMAFTADSQAHYTLDVSIQPDTMLKDDQGFVLFRSGGHEGISL
jgi:hypothetical protein